VEAGPGFDRAGRFRPNESIMPLLRKIHLYLGCIFAPALIFLAFTGALQLYDLHESRKDGSYVAPKLVAAMGWIHKHQNLPGDPRGSGKVMKAFMVAASAGLLLTTLLGVFMAFRLSRSAITVWACLGAGVGLPVVMLFLIR
jgi:hypothetical protein